MNRRGFLKGLGGIFLAGAAPAIVRADSLMRVVPVETTVLTEEEAFQTGFDEAAAGADETYIAFIHPDSVLDFERQVAARTRLTREMIAAGVLGTYGPGPVLMVAPRSKMPDNAIPLGLIERVNMAKNPGDRIIAHRVSPLTPRLNGRRSLTEKLARQAGSTSR